MPLPAAAAAAGPIIWESLKDLLIFLGLEWGIRKGGGALLKKLGGQEIGKRAGTKLASTGAGMMANKGLVKAAESLPAWAGKRLPTDVGGMADWTLQGLGRVAPFAAAVPATMAVQSWMQGEDSPMEGLDTIPIAEATPHPYADSERLALDRMLADASMQSAIQSFIQQGGDVAGLMNVLQSGSGRIL
jgi:hypothetical protein